MLFHDELVLVIVFVGQSAEVGVFEVFLPALWHFVFDIMKIKINDTLTFEAAAVVDNLTEESREQVRAASSSSASFRAVSASSSSVGGKTAKKSSFTIPFANNSRAYSSDRKSVV